MTEEESDRVTEREREREREKEREKEIEKVIEKKIRTESPILTASKLDFLLSPSG